MILRVRGRVGKRGRGGGEAGRQGGGAQPLFGFLILQVRGRTRGRGGGGAGGAGFLKVP